MTNPNTPLHPIVLESDQMREVYSGITIREHFTLEILKILIPLNPGCEKYSTGQQDVARNAVELTDAVIAKLNLGADI